MGNFVQFTSRSLFGLGLVFALAGSLCLGADYGEQTGNNTDVIHLRDSRVDFELRLSAIRNAKKSVEMISFSQTDDEAGMPLIQAMRDAANNGVEVKTAFDKYASINLGALKNFPFMQGLFVDTAQLLADSNLARPVQVMMGNTARKWAHGLAWDDFMHHKILIIDRGTPNEMIFFGGRGVTNLYLRVMDSVLLLRPVDHTKPHVGQDIGKFFDTFWNGLKPVFPLEKPAPLTEHLTRRVSTPSPSYLRTDQEKADFAELRAKLETPPRAEDTLAPNQFRPASLRLVTNDLLSTALTRTSGGSPASRNLFPNDILAYTNHLIRHSPADALSIDLTAYSIAPPPEFKRALLDHLRRGGTVNLYTNGRKAHEILVPGGATVHHTYAEVLELIEQARGLPGKVNLFILDAEKATGRPAPENEIFYVHRKGLLVGDIFITGSENYTWSGRKNDESIVAIHDPRLAAHMRGINEQEKPLYNLVDEQEIRRRHSTRPFYFPLCRDLFRRLW